MKLNFIFNNSSISRFTYNYRLESEDIVNKIFSYYYRGISYKDNALLKKDVEYYTQPLYDSLNDQGGSLYMSVGQTCKTISFVNMTIPMHINKFIMRFAPLFIYYPVSVLKNERNDLYERKTYMILSISIFINNILFLSLGFKSDGKIYLTNSTTTPLDNPDNIITNSYLTNIDTCRLYETFYIIIEKDTAFIYLYKTNTDITLTNDTSQNLELMKKRREYNYRKNKTANITPELYQIATIKGINNNNLTEKNNQFMNVIIDSKYISNNEVFYLYNVNQKKKTNAYLSKYFLKYVDFKFKERFKYLDSVKSNLQNKLLNSINIKFNTFLSTIDDANKYKSLYIACRSNLISNLIPKITNYFESEVLGIKKLENELKQQFIENNNSLTFIQTILSEEYQSKLFNVAKSVTSNANVNNIQATQNILEQIDDDSLEKYKLFIKQSLDTEIDNIINSTYTNYNINIPQIYKTNLENCIGTIPIAQNSTSTSDIRSIIRSTIDKEFNEISKILLPELSENEKNNISKKIESELDSEYSFSYDKYNYIVHLDDVELLYMIPYELTEYSNLNFYNYTLAQIFDKNIPDRIKFKNIIDNYDFSQKNITITNNGETLSMT